MFIISLATSPGFQGDSFTLEKPQPAIGALSPTSKTPSMMARLDPTQLDPSAHMYKENHGVRLGHLLTSCLKLLINLDLAQSLPSDYLGWSQSSYSLAVNLTADLPAFSLKVPRRLS